MNNKLDNQNNTLNINDLVLIAESGNNNLKECVIIEFGNKTIKVKDSDNYIYHRYPEQVIKLIKR